MREIKFRAWHKKDKFMHIVSELFFREGGFCDFELMQYTGLKDKNGKEIYEGDIVNYTSINGKSIGKYVVEWYEYKCGYILSGINKESELWNRDWEPMRAEITGNIYENPELTEGK